MPKKEQKLRKRWYPGKPLIPGAVRTRLEHQGETYITLNNGWMSADIYKDGELNVSIDSRKIAPEHLALDEGLTQEFRRFLEEEAPPGSWLDQREAWIKSKKWRLGEFGSDNTYNLDNTYFWGDTFEYSHFITDEGEEGAILKWQEVGGGYSNSEVWMGDFSNFMNLQEEGDPGSPETFLSVNDLMEGGLVLALDELGALNHPEDLPVFMQKALSMIAEEGRRTRERATGQTYFWPELPR